MADMTYQEILYQIGLGNVNLSSATIRLALIADTYSSPAVTDSHATIIAQEASGTGYTAGGATIANQDWSKSGNNVVLDGDNVTWSSASVTARYGYLYVDAATDVPICLYDYGSNKTADGGDFVHQFNASGAWILRNAD